MVTINSYSWNAPVVNIILTIRHCYQQGHDLMRWCLNHQYQTVWGASSTRKSLLGWANTALPYFFFFYLQNLRITLENLADFHSYTITYNWLYYSTINNSVINVIKDLPVSIPWDRRSERGPFRWFDKWRRSRSVSYRSHLYKQ